MSGESGGAAAALSGGDSGQVAPNGGGGASEVQAPEWLAGAEPDLVEYHSKRGTGWKAPADVLKSYRELEQKATWSDAVRLPKDGADPKAWDDVWNKLGRPEKPEPQSYGYSPEDPSDAKIAEELAGAFHRAGLNSKQGKEVFDAIKGLGDTEADDAARYQKNSADHVALRNEWGQAYEAKVELGRRAARAMGIDIDALNAIENALGTRFVFEKFAQAGQFLREDAGVETTAGIGGVANIEAQIKQLRSDPEFIKRLESDNYNVVQAANKELSDLYKRAFPDPT